MARGLHAAEPRVSRAPRAAAAPGAAVAPSFERLGPWELVAHVAAGEFCNVFRARPAESAADTAPTYAVKRLKPEYADEARGVTLLRREARVGRSVGSPHLVAILDAQTARAPHYLVMPWLEGGTLGSLLANADAPLPVSFALWAARQIVEALAALDRAGWMHADVKPANIMIAPSGHATLLDLGLARRPADEDAGLAPGILGTPWYIAPEVLLSVGRPDIRSDLYSLGVVLYEMLAGRVPFPCEDADALIAAHRAAEIPPLRELAPHLPTAVAQLVHTLLAKEPLRRPQSPRELLRELIGLEVDYFAEEVTRE